MLNSAVPSSEEAEPTHDEIDAIVRKGPSGAMALAGLTTFIVVAIWVIFYLFVFVPRGGTP